MKRVVFLARHGTWKALYDPAKSDGSLRKMSK